MGSIGLQGEHRPVHEDEAIAILLGMLQFLLNPTVLPCPGCLAGGVQEKEICVLQGK